MAGSKPPVHPAFTREGDAAHISLKTSCRFIPSRVHRLDDIERLEAGLMHSISSDLTTDVKGAFAALKARVEDLPKVPDWNNITNAQVTATRTTFTTFRCERVVATVTTKATYRQLPHAITGVGLRTVEAEGGEAVELAGLYSGSCNFFPNAPVDGAGINCATLTPDGPRQSWPVVFTGIPITANFSVSPSLLRVPAPPDCEAVPEETEVTIMLTLFGRQLSAEEKQALRSSNDPASPPAL